MQIRPSISYWMRIASFVAAVLVVGIHTNNSSLLGDIAVWNRGLHYWLCTALNQYAVPFFFAVSGFWFANGKYVGNKESLQDFYICKFRTLLIPYLFWVAATVPLMNGVYIVLNVVAHREILSGTIFEFGGLWKMVDSVFAIVNTMPVCNGPMWYVRTLILFFLLAPIWKVFCKKRTAWFLLVIFAADKMIEGGLLPRFVALVPEYPSCFILGICLRVYIPNKWLFVPVGGKKANYPAWLGWSFWIYCIHTFIGAMMIPITSRLPRVDWVVAVATPTLILTKVAIAIVLAYMTKRYFSKLFEIVNGGRG